MIPEPASQGGSHSRALTRDFDSDSTLQSSQYPRYSSDDYDNAVKIGVDVRCNAPVDFYADASFCLETAWIAHRLDN